MRFSAALFAILAGCAGSLPRLERLQAIPDDSCHVRTWEILARGLGLPKTPLTLQIEQESDHLAGSVLGDWGRLLVSFRLDTNRVSMERPWFSGVGLGAGELAGLAVGLWDPARLLDGLGAGWTLRRDDTVDVLLNRGTVHSFWGLPDSGRRVVRDAHGNWRMEASLVQEQVLTPGSCRVR